MFTIIVPTHNRPLLLRRTLRSLAAQTFTQFQVIVVDDMGAYIPPFPELATLQGRYHYLIRSGESGPAVSRNMALALCAEVPETHYILFLDDDDTLEPEHLANLAKHIGSTRPPLLFCDFKVQHEDRTSDPPQALSQESFSIGGVVKDSLFVRNSIPNSCLVYRSDVIRHVRYDTSMLIYEDWDFALQCLTQHELQHVPTNTVVIHKSRATAPENMRRGNTRDDLIAPVMLALYKKRPALNGDTRLARQALLAGAGIPVVLEDC